MGQPDGGERGVDHVDQRHVVVAGDGHVGRHAQAGGLQRVVGAQRHQVVRAHHGLGRRRALREQLGHGHAAGFPAVRLAGHHACAAQPPVAQRLLETLQATQAGG
jgi:hypothetical protein